MIQKFHFLRFIYIGVSILRFVNQWINNNIMPGYFLKILKTVFEQQQLHHNVHMNILPLVLLNPVNYVLQLAPG